jgi:hypothetical protein
MKTMSLNHVARLAATIIMITAIACLGLQAWDARACTSLFFFGLGLFLGTT